MEIQNAFSVNNEGDGTPLLQRRLFRSLSGSGAATSSEISINLNNAECDTSKPADSHRTLGTVAGVFSPVALSMFSALLFLRVGYLVGNAGLLETLLQFAIAYTILFFTVSSVCAISTNGAIEGGGCYFMISRTLGPEFGGSIGTLFCFANIVSSSLYLTGCAEGLIENFGPSGFLISHGLPDGRWWRFLYGSVLNLINVGVCLTGAAAFARTSFVILSIVVTCLGAVLVSFLAQGAMQIPIPEANQLVQNDTFRVNGSYTGFQTSTLASNLYPHYGQDYSSGGTEVNFAMVFGVLFSGVTGIMAGANMSGELKDPGRSIPVGTLSAVCFSFCIYVILSLFTASTCSPFLLQNHFLYLQSLCLWPPFVTIGIVAATWSSAISNLIGSSRVLAALARDNIFGPVLTWVNVGTHKGNPWASVLGVGVGVELCLLIGSLNQIAQLNSVLFLLSYAATNVACLMPELSSAPNFRPTFRLFSWHTTLLGLIGTLVMMFVINAIYASVAVILCLVLVISLHLFSPGRTANWGSISQAIIFHQVRKYLLLLDSRKDHVKFWRPQVLLLVSNPRSAAPLITFVNALKKSGLYVLGHVKIASNPDAFFDQESTSQDIVSTGGEPSVEEQNAWLAIIDKLKVKAFLEVTIASSVREGLRHLIRLSGLGAMKPNTVILGFYDQTRPKDFLQDLSPNDRASGVAPSSSTLSIASLSDGIFPLRSSEVQTRPSVFEYVAMVSDALKMQKNVCLCRHFHNLDIAKIKSGKDLLYLDVWPMDFLSTRISPVSPDWSLDTTGLFLLQLACIVNMVPQWKQFQVRVFLCVQPEEVVGSEREVRLKALLQQLRINSKVKLVTFPAETIPRWTDYSDPALPAYMQQLNGMVLAESERTAVSFLYLPSPPPPSRKDNLAEAYLMLLSSLSQNLPPTLFVQGVSPVTSTHL